jgi:hypothetical protein
MPAVIPIGLLLVAVCLIVYGRVNHRRHWGDRIAIAGYAVLGVALITGLVARGLIS